jgi:hypothetical protein
MSQTKKTIRQLMPSDYGPELVKRTGANLRHIYRVVNNEHTTAEIWPFVLELAEEHQKQVKLEQRKLSRLKSEAV